MIAGLPVAAPTTCEDITVPMCQIGIDYTQTAMPNYWNMATQEEAERELQQFYPLVNRLSSVILRSFLCAVYVPRYFFSIEITQSSYLNPPSQYCVARTLWHTPKTVSED
jgi:hypothetical protein